LNPVTLVFGLATALKSLLFDESTPSAIGISWHMNAHSKPIQTKSLLMASSSIFLSVDNNLPF
jgi:hypothetical protein